MHILLVEDDAEMAAYLQKGLKEFGHSRAALIMFSVAYSWGGGASS
jgi:DNA-binding response OmpR family regulator